VTRYFAEGTIYAGYLAGELIGCSMLRQNFIIGLFVRRDLQGNGFGTILLDHALSKALDERVTVVGVSSSITAVKFYQKSNFRFIARYKGSGYDMMLHYRRLGADSGAFRVPVASLWISVAFDRMIFGFKELQRWTSSKIVW
jgi:GNAT superfamily N-acetyltransferase